MMADHPQEGSLSESPQVSPQALQVLKAISDQFDIIKKQQWATTNYAVLIYAAIAWLRYHVRGSQVFSCALVTVAIIVGLVASTLLIWFQFDLGELRQRADTANSRLFSTEERDALGLSPWKHPYLRGLNVLLALIAVCLFGAGLVVAAVILGPKPD
jgi:hypothetical protein